MTPDQVFCLRGANGLPEWRAFVGGKVVAATWYDRGAAEAGLAVERRRLAPRLCPICGQRVDDGNPCGCGARR